MSLSNLRANEGPQFSVLVNPVYNLEASIFLQKFCFIFQQFIQPKCTEFAAASQHSTYTETERAAASLRQQSAVQAEATAS